ncbi:hypothetical protein C2W62_31815 [Candidatus Entotheonella serta]|nr:hypothetical protein C2W62_31815 [Candidatus Entotheonella serta]
MARVPGGLGRLFLIFDYDRDGWLDLVVANYVTWAPELEAGLDCTYGTPDKDYCPVRYFQGEGLLLYHNRGDGTFDDVTDTAGVASSGTRAFAPAIFDLDDDGWLDIFVASDGTPSRLWRNLGDGTFEDVGVQTGIVLDESGAAYAGIGIDFTFPRNNDQLCVAIGNFVGEPTTMHCRVPCNRWCRRSRIMLRRMSISDPFITASGSTIRLGSMPARPKG